MSSQTHPGIMFYKLSGYPLAQSIWYIKLTIMERNLKILNENLYMAINYPIIVHLLIHFEWPMELLDSLMLKIISIEPICFSSPSSSQINFSLNHTSSL